MTPEVFAQAISTIADDRQRAILSLLAVVYPKPLSRIQISDSVWHGSPPVSSFTKIKHAIIGMNAHLAPLGWIVKAHVEGRATPYSVVPVEYRLERVEA